MEQIKIFLDENKHIVINEILSEEELLELADSFAEKIDEIYIWDNAYNYLLDTYEEKLIQNYRLIEAIHKLFVKVYYWDDDFEARLFIDHLHYLITKNLINSTEEKDYIDILAQVSPYAFSELVKFYFYNK